MHPRGSRPGAGNRYRHGTCREGRDHVGGEPGSKRYQASGQRSTALRSLHGWGRSISPGHGARADPLGRFIPQKGAILPHSGRILVIDHCGHDLYRSITPGTCGVLAIGDDTTAVCGHICSHLGIPVFGVIGRGPGRAPRRRLLPRIHGRRGSRGKGRRGRAGTGSDYRRWAGGLEGLGRPGPCTPRGQVQGHPPASRGTAVIRSQSGLSATFIRRKACP